MTIYLDVIFLENLLMNYIILYATGVILKVKLKWVRILLSSLLGSVYAVISYIDIFDIYSNVFFKIILSVVMVHISFNSKGIKTLIKQILIFYLTSFAFGGCAFFLLYFVKPGELLMKNGVYIGTYPIKIVLVGSIIAFIIITTAFKIIKVRFSKKDIYCNVKIFFDNKQINLKALLDTGNMLKDPISGTPVIVVEKQELCELLPNEILENLDQIITGKWIGEVEDKYKSKFKVIPFNSLGKQNGILLGFKVDLITIVVEDEIKVIKDVVMGIYNNRLSKTGSYKALIGLDILERSEEKDEYIASIKV